MKLFLCSHKHLPPCNEGEALVNNSLRATPRFHRARISRATRASTMIPEWRFPERTRRVFSMLHVRSPVCCCTRTVSMISKLQAETLVTFFCPQMSEKRTAHQSSLAYFYAATAARNRQRRGSVYRGRNMRPRCTPSPGRAREEAVNKAGRDRSDDARPGPALPCPAGGPLAISYRQKSPITIRELHPLKNRCQLRHSGWKLLVQHPSFNGGLRSGL